MITADAHPSHRGPILLALVLFVILVSVARSVDVPRAGYGVKSDEATYVAMALSLAHDGNLSYERRDFERFAGVYRSGPEGIFLKRGRSLSVEVSPPFPFVRLIARPDPDTEHLYFGKAFIYPVFAAPFVWVYGLNGMLLFHVLLLTGVGVCGYLFLAAQSPPRTAALATTAFLGAAALPVYIVFLMPEVFNLSLVFFAYFLWLYKEVRPGEDRHGATSARWLAGGWTDVAAAVLLGLATYSKPIPHGVLVAPLVLLAWTRRRWAWGSSLGAVAVFVTVALFAVTAAISGDYNYQGGDRKTFYGRFPFDAPESTWQARGGGVIDDPGTAAQDVLTSGELPQRFARNLGYFVFGRHFGFVPYYFPGAVAIVAWLLSRARRDAWRLLTFGAFVSAAVGLLLVLPFTWSGGGGPPGNRYLLSAYPVLFFLLPPTGLAAAGIVAWIGGALFTAKLLVTPFESAKFTWQIAEKGLLRRLPVELPMVQDLPVMLAQPLRGRIPYGHDPFLLLYFLDQNAFPPEPSGMWVSGSGRADIIVRSEKPIQFLAVEAESPIHTVLTVSLGRGDATVTLEPGQIARFNVPASGVPGRSGYAYLMKAQSSEGFVPHARDPQSSDYRNLGAQLRFRAVNEPGP
jgi:hypothetical protein